MKFLEIILIWADSTFQYHASRMTGVWRGVYSNSVRWLVNKVKVVWVWPVEKLCLSVKRKISFLSGLQIQPQVAKKEFFVRGCNFLRKFSLTSLWKCNSWRLPPEHCTRRTTHNCAQCSECRIEHFFWIFEKKLSWKYSILIRNLNCSLIFFPIPGVKQKSMF